MFTQDINLNIVDWHIRIYYCFDRMFSDEVLDELLMIGCSGSLLRDAKKSLWSGAKNTGLTYSNLDTHETIMVVGQCTSAAEYYNSINHEQDHVVQHIIQSYGISPYGEDSCYISGEIAENMFKMCKKLFCDCCRKKIRRVL